LVKWFILMSHLTHILALSRGSCDRFVTHIALSGIKQNRSPEHGRVMR
jgi:hypothetical protein